MEAKWSTERLGGRVAWTGPQSCWKLDGGVESSSFQHVYGTSFIQHVYLESNNVTANELAS